MGVFCYEFKGTRTENGFPKVHKQVSRCDGSSIQTLPTSFPFYLIFVLGSMAAFTSTIMHDKSALAVAPNLEPSFERLVRNNVFLKVVAGFGGARPYDERLCLADRLR